MSLFEFIPLRNQFDITYEQYELPLLLPFESSTAPIWPLVGMNLAMKHVFTKLTKQINSKKN